MPNPNYDLYHKSISAELLAVKDRIGQLISHTNALGNFKEAILRSVLRRHLPANLSIGRGFIVSPRAVSTELDLLIIDQSKPVLFQDGDVFIVTPDAVKAVVEVKTQINSLDNLKTALRVLGKVGGLCWETAGRKPWLGLYIYEPAYDDSDVMDQLTAAAEQSGHAVNCFTFGEDRFFRFWKRNEYDQGELPIGAAQCRFRCYEIAGLSPSYFIGNLIDAVSALDRSTNSYAWFPLPDGKDRHRRIERVVELDDNSHR